LADIGRFLAAKKDPKHKEPIIFGRKHHKKPTIFNKKYHKHQKHSKHLGHHKHQKHSKHHGHHKHQKHSKRHRHHSPTGTHKKPRKSKHPTQHQFSKAQHKLQHQFLKEQKLLQKQYLKEQTFITKQVESGYHRLQKFSKSNARKVSNEFSKLQKASMKMIQKYMTHMYHKSPQRRLQKGKKH
jgi:hypothetical protein